MNQQELLRLREQATQWLWNHGHHRRADWQQLLNHPDPTLIIRECQLYQRLERETAFPFHPLPGAEAEGPVKLGIIPYRHIWTGTTVGELVRTGLGVTGGRSLGKSTLVKLIARQLRYFLILDITGEYADLAAHDPYVQVIDIRDISIPPFLQEGLAPDEARIHGLKACVTFASVEGLLTLSLGYLQELYLSAAARLGTYAVPVEELVRESYLKKKGFGPQGDASQRVRGRLTQLWNELERIIAGSKSFVRHFFRKRIVLRITSLASTESRNYIIATLLKVILAYRAAHPPIDPDDYLAIITDESHLLFSRHAEISKESGRAAFVQPFLDLRKPNIALFWVTQNPSLFSQIILSNTSTLISYRLTDQRDLYEIKAALGLSERQVAWLRELPRFTALVKLPHVPGVFPIQTVPLARLIANEDYLQKRKAAFFAAIGWEVPREAPSILELLKSSPESKTPETGGNGALAGRARELLQLACERPFLTLAELQKILGWGGSGFQQAVRSLRLLPALITFVDLSTGLRGKPPAWARASIAAFELLELPVPNCTTAYGKNDGLHRFWEERVLHFHRAKGLKAWRDREFNGKRVDVAVENEQGLLAVEIQLSPNTLTNIQDNARAGFKRQLALYPHRQLLESERDNVASAVTPELLAQVQFDYLGNYWKEVE